MPLIQENPSTLVDEAGRSEHATTYLSQEEFLKELESKSDSKEDKGAPGREFVRGIKAILTGE